MKLFNTTLLGFLVLLCLACNDTTSNKRETRQVQDYFDRTVNLVQNVQRTIPIYYVQAEIICAIGGKNKIVGIGKINENSSIFLKTYFPGMLDLPQVGQSNISYEKIISLKPDVVFTGTERPVVERLEQLGYATIATYPNTLNEISDEIVLYGNVLGKEKEASAIYNFFQDISKRLSEISKSIPQTEKPTVYYIRTDPLITLGGNVLGEIIELSGGKLVTSGIGDNATSLQMSFEDIYKYNPEVIIIRDRASVKPEDIYKDVRWKTINAVKNKRIFQERSGWTEFRLETIFGVIEKAKWLHPELFKDFDAVLEYKRFIEIVKANGQ